MKKLILAFLLLATHTSFSQETESGQSEFMQLERSIVSLDLLSPGISFEAAVGRKSSLYTSLTLKPLFEGTSPPDQPGNSSFILNPVIFGQYRKYYNLEKRYKAGRNTAYNSGNYFGLHVGYQSGAEIYDEYRGSLDMDGGINIGPVWGIQRNGTFTFNLKSSLEISNDD